MLDYNIFKIKYISIDVEKASTWLKFFSNFSVRLKWLTMTNKCDKIYKPSGERILKEIYKTLFASVLYVYYQTDYRKPTCDLIRKIKNGLFKVRSSHIISTSILTRTSKF